jgi:outer membrane cobalamin receptor
MHGLAPRVLLGTVAAFAALFTPAAANGDSDAEPAAESVMTETVTVTATRLSSEPEVVGEVPAQVTIIEREQIERSGVRTLQDLLSL